MPGGRPTKYEPWMIDKAIELGKQGDSLAGIAAGLGIAKITLNAWRKENPEFSAAISLAQTYAQKHWEDIGKGALYADKFQAAVYNKRIAGQFSDDYMVRVNGREDGEQPSHDPRVVDALISALLEKYQK
jgi:hypothetical protein